MWTSNRKKKKGKEEKTWENSKFWTIPRSDIFTKRSSKPEKFKTRRVEESKTLNVLFWVQNSWAYTQARVNILYMPSRTNVAGFFRGKTTARTTGRK